VRSHSGGLTLFELQRLKWISIFFELLPIKIVSIGIGPVIGKFDPTIASNRHLETVARPLSDKVILRRKIMRVELRRKKSGLIRKRHSGDSQNWLAQSFHADCAWSHYTLDTIRAVLHLTKQRMASA
jgi:hypothetical protein